MTAREDHLESVTTRLAQVVADQQTDADPAHEDFYAWGAALTELIYRLGGLCRVLDGQIEHYGDRRILYDDEGADPAKRVAEMRFRLAGVGIHLENALMAAQLYHSEASHLAVAVDPEATP